MNNPFTRLGFLIASDLIYSIPISIYGGKADLYRYLNVSIKGLTNDLVDAVPLTTSDVALSHNRLILTMGNSIADKDGLYIWMGPSILHNYATTVSLYIETWYGTIFGERYVLHCG